MKIIHYLRSGMLMLASLACLQLPALAQADKYKPGDKIEYKDTSYATVWEPGVYVGATPGDKQPIIRKKADTMLKEFVENIKKQLTRQ